jgi:hypothetical protein
MKKIIFVLTTAMFLLSATFCFAASEIPNLLGTWAIKAEGTVLIKGDKPGAKTHWEKADQKIMTAEAKVIEQKGRILHGEIISKKATEKFIAVIGPDNMTIYYADEDGIMDMKIISKDTIQAVYRHVKQEDSVVSVGTWTRKK